MKFSFICECSASDSLFGDELVVASHPSEKPIFLFDDEESLFNSIPPSGKGSVVGKNSMPIFNFDEVEDQEDNQKLQQEIVASKY